MTQRELRAKQGAVFEFEVREHYIFCVWHSLEVDEDQRDTQLHSIYSLLRVYYFTFLVKQNMNAGMNALEDLKGMLLIQ